MSHLGSERSGFIGIDPDGLRDLARLVEARAEHLRVHAMQAADVAEAMAVPLLSRVVDRLQGTAAELAVWSRGVEHRIVAIQSVRRAATAVLSTFADGIVAGAASLDGAPELDLARTYRLVDAALLDDGNLGEVEQRRLPALVANLDASDLVQLADMLIGGGHDMSAVAAIGAAAGTSSRQVARAVLERLEERLGYGDLVASVFAGNLVAGVRGETRRSVADWMATRPALVAVVMGGAAVTDDDRGRPNDSLNRISGVLAELDDVDQIAAVVVELIAAQQGRLPAPDLAQLDEAIKALIDPAPQAVMTQLATVTDRNAAAMVLWMRHLVNADHGPGNLGLIIADVVGAPQMDPLWFSDPGPGHRFDNATTAAYLSTSLSLAVQQEADDATGEIAVMAAAAAFTEMAIPVAGRAVRAVEVLVPAGLTVGVGSAARAADRRIDESMEALLERIDERFEVPADADVAGLARALHVFDQHRDALVEHWRNRR